MQPAFFIAYVCENMMRLPCEGWDIFANNIFKSYQN